LVLRGSLYSVQFICRLVFLAVVVAKATAADAEFNSMERHNVVETSTAAESSESTDVSTSNPATTRTLMSARTTFDELMQALSELEADDPLPPSSRHTRSWCQFSDYYMLSTVDYCGVRQ